MDNTLILQTKGSVSEPLRKVTEMRIKIKKRGDGSILSGLDFQPNASGITVSLLKGNGFLSTSSTATSGSQSLNLTQASHVFYVKLTADDVICVDDMNNLEYINGLTNNPVANAPIAEDDMSVFRYCTNLKYINIRGSAIKGDIKALSALALLQYINITTYTTGNLDSLSNLTDLRNLYLQSSYVEGDIASLSACTLLSNINITNCFNIVGDIAAFSNTLLIKIEADNSRIHGDINNMPGNRTTFLGLATQTSVSYSGSTDKKFSYMECLYINRAIMTSSQLDNLLISLSKTTWSGSKILAYRSGIRTSASDAAISLLQSQGVTISSI